MSRQKQYQLRSRRNGLIIPIPAHNQGVIPRFGIEDNQMIFAPVDGSGRRAKIHQDDTPVVMGGHGGPERVVSGRSTLAVEDAVSSPTEVTHETEQDHHEHLEATPVEEVEEPKPKPTRARKAAKKAAKPAAPDASDELV